MDQNGHGRSRYANSSKRSNGTHNGPFMYKVINVVMKARWKEMNSLNIIPTYIITVLLCIMSYWHGSSEYGWRKAGLILNLILGLVFSVLVIKMPMFL